jgi:lysophospholipase L1-like esterase
MSSGRRRVARALLALACAALLALVVAELVVRTNRERFGTNRIELWDLRAWVCDGRSRFRPTAYYGWTFDPKRPGVNTSGFLGIDVARARRPGVTRIACLGGSTTAGSLFEGYAGSYPGALVAVLEQRLGRPVEVLNFGMPGWTTAESLVHWVLDGKDYRPDVVLVHHASNDLFPRLAPGFRSDYTNFFHPWRAERASFLRRFLTRWSDLFTLIQLHGPEFELFEHVAVPQAELPLAIPPGTDGVFRRNLETLLANLRADGATPVVMTMIHNPGEASTPMSNVCIAGLVEHNEVARTVAAEQGCALFDLARVENAGLESSYLDLVHLTPQGNRRKAELVADFLIANGLVPVP